MDVIRVIRSRIIVNKNHWLAKSSAEKIQGHLMIRTRLVGRQQVPGVVADVALLGYRALEAMAHLWLIYLPKMGDVP